MITTVNVCHQVRFNIKLKCVSVWVLQTEAALQSWAVQFITFWMWFRFLDLQTNIIELKQFICHSSLYSLEMFWKRRTWGNAPCWLDTCPLRYDSTAADRFHFSLCFTSSSSTRICSGPELGRSRNAGLLFLADRSHGAVRKSGTETTT